MLLLFDICILPGFCGKTLILNLNVKGETEETLLKSLSCSSVEPASNPQIRLSYKKESDDISILEVEGNLCK